jgi:starch synthase
MTEKNYPRICMLGAEVAPYAAVGEVSEVLRGLPTALAQLGAETRVVAPYHRSLRKWDSVREIGTLQPIRIGENLYHGKIYADQSQDPIQNYFIGCPPLFDRRGVYEDLTTGQDHPDNFERFDFFSLAAMECLKEWGWRPDLIHCHDAHTALVPAYLKLLKMGEDFFSRVVSVLTLYDLSYHAQFDGSNFQLTALPQELFYPMGPFEYYGKLSTLKAGICYADIINTVSGQYAREIQTREFGCGLEDVLKRRNRELSGILNGIDTKAWDPGADPLIQANFSQRSLAGKRKNKRHLQKLCGFPQLDIPLVGMDSRLPQQDGIELFVQAAHELKKLDFQFVILGENVIDQRLGLRSLSAELPKQFSLQEDYSREFFHQVHAGCDMFLMPSKSQPCGMNQLYAMRYGTIPLVRHAGGLVETVTQFDPATQEGHGFKFYSYEAGELVRVLKDAAMLWKDSKMWRKLVENAMAQDYSWGKSAREYLSLYQRAIS